MLSLQRRSDEHWKIYRKEFILTSKYSVTLQFTNAVCGFFLIYKKK